MKIGIVWLPNVWKSTLFNALTKSYSADAANFPFCTIDPNVWIVDVKDGRVQKLSVLSNSKKTIYANIEFVDIAGLVKWAWKWEWLGNKFLSHIREVDAIVQVLRHFEDNDISHVEGEVDPQRDINIINNELIFADLEQLERKLPTLQKKARVTWDKYLKKEVELLEKVQNTLQEEKMAHILLDFLSDDDKKILKSYRFLTMKPIVYALNIGQEDLARASEIQKEYHEKLHENVAIVCAKLESDLLDLEEVEKQAFIVELLEIEHVNHIPTLDNLIVLAFQAVGLMYYFTTWEKETKAWIVKIDSTAPQAAGAIHTDFERWFIKAEIVACQDLLDAGSWVSAKEKWKIRLEWKEYIVQDGDVIVFKFNV